MIETGLSRAQLTAFEPVWYAYSASTVSSEDFVEPDDLKSRFAKEDAD